MTLGIILSIGSALAGLQGASQENPMTMDEAVTIAERNAFATRLQQTTVEKDRQAIAVALANMSPTIGLNTLFNQAGQEVTASFGQGTAPVVISPFNTVTTTAAFSLPIDISGSTHRLWLASRQTYEAARQQLEESFNDARLNARTAFLAVLRNRDLVRVAEENLKDAQGRLEQAQLEFQQQQIAKIDVDRLDAQVAQAESGLTSAQNNLQLSDNAFNLALARPIETPVNLVDVNDMPPIPANADNLAKMAQQYRPDVRALNSQIQALGNIRRAQEGTMEPSMTLGLNYQRNLNPTFLAGNPNSLNMTVALSIPVFDSGATRARVRSARQDEKAAHIQLEQTQLGISQEVRNAITSMTSASSSLKSAQRQVTLAEEVFRLAKVRQMAGEGTYVEVVDAESSLATARNLLVGAKYDYFLAFSQLQHAVGNDRVNEPAPGAKPLATGGKK
ncbi:MAG TPA: TolC family protein [Fimbriimonas sp.]|nr:TolC family protein [Fimbriimonas sp.]